MSAANLATTSEPLFWVRWPAPDDCWYFIRDRNNPAIWKMTNLRPEPVSRREAIEVQSLVRRHIAPAPALVAAS